MSAYAGALTRSAAAPSHDPHAHLCGTANRGARAIVEPLQDLCADSGVSCMMVAHSTKDGKLQGSGGLRDAVRLLYKVAPDPLVRVVSAEKSNNLASSEPLKFVIEDRGGRAAGDLADELGDRQAAAFVA